MTKGKLRKIFVYGTFAKKARKPRKKHPSYVEVKRVPYETISRIREKLQKRYRGNIYDEGKKRSRYLINGCVVDCFNEPTDYRGRPDIIFCAESKNKTNLNALIKDVGL